MSNLKISMVHFPVEIYEKIKCISKIEKRSVKGQIEWIVEEYLRRKDIIEVLSDHGFKDEQAQKPSPLIPDSADSIFKT